MRASLLLTVLLISSTARADSFGDLVGGIAIPLGDHNWTNTVGASPKLGVHAGATSGDLGGMLGVDWTPEDLNSGGGGFPGGSASLSMYRIRILAHFILQHRVTPRLTIEGRAGVGVDIAHDSGELTILGSTSSASDTDVGFAFELGGGVWYDVTTSIQLGGALAFPIGHHSQQAQKAGDFSFDYTTYDLDLLFGVRVWSR